MVEQFVHNFPNTKNRIHDYIFDFKLTNFHRLPATLKLKLYQSYVYDNREDFIGDLFCDIEDEDLVTFFDHLLHPNKSSHLLFRAIVVKYLYKNYQEFFDKIFKYELEQRSVDHDMES